MDMYLHVWTHKYISIFHIYINVSLVYTYVYIHICIDICMYLYIYIDIYGYLYVHWASSIQLIEKPLLTCPTLILFFRYCRPATALVSSAEQEVELWRGIPLHALFKLSLGWYGVFRSMGGMCNTCYWCLDWDSTKNYWCITSLQHSKHFRLGALQTSLFYVAEQCMNNVHCQRCHHKLLMIRLNYSVILALTGCKSFLNVWAIDLRTIFMMWSYFYRSVYGLIAIIPRPKSILASRKVLWNLWDVKVRFWIKMVVALLDLMAKNIEKIRVILESAIEGSASSLGRLGEETTGDASALARSENTRGI